MGDRFILELECAHCRHKNKDLLFALDWGEKFICEKCKKKNHIKIAFKAYKLEGEENGET